MPQPIPIDYTSAGELPPHPLTEEQKAQLKENSENCLCPFLKTAYVQGQLEADELGYAPLEKVYNVMDWAGVGRMAFPTSGYFYKFGITGVPILHLAQNRPNDSGILHGNIGTEERKARLDELLSFADENGEFSYEEFWNFAQYRCEKDGCESSAVFSVKGEFSTMLVAFGKDCQSGRRCLTTDDITALWFDNEWPEGYSERRRPETSVMSRIDVDMGYQIVKMTLLQRKREKQAGAPVFFEHDDLPREYRPYDAIISDTPGVPVLTAEEIAKIPGGEICIWDSRAGGVQPTGSERWVFGPSDYQTTVEEATGIAPVSPFRNVFILVIIGVVVYFLNNLRKSKRNEYESV